MNPTTKAAVIEARALALADSRLEDERGTYEWSIEAEIVLRECAAALRPEPEPTPEPGERERFEAWANEDFYSGLTDIGDTWDAERAFYTDFTHHMAFHAWRAARASLPPAPEPVAGWQPIDSAPKDGTKALYWVAPKTGEEAYADSNGVPIVSTAPPHIFYGLHGGWSSLEKAILWQPVLPPAPTKGATRPAQQPDTDGTAPLPPRA